MNSKAEVRKALQNEKNSIIPINHRGFSGKIGSYILGRDAFVGGGIQQWREAKSWHEGWHDEFLDRSFRDAVDVSLRTNQDIMRPEYWRAPECPTRKIDEYTYLYEHGEQKDWRILRHDPVSEQTSYFYYHPRECTLDDLRELVKKLEKTEAGYKPSEEDFVLQVRAQKEYGEEKMVEAFGGMEVGLPLADINVWLEAMLLDPGLVKALISLQVIRCKKNIEFLSGLGFECFLGGMDFASDHGPMYSLKLFRELILPGLIEVVNFCHEHKVYYFFASDGDLWPVADALFGESGIDCYFEVDKRAGMGLKELREQYPQLTLMGNISSWTLSQGSREDVENEALGCLEDAKKYGGIIVGISNYFQPETPYENVDILLETIEKNRHF
jgi:Uroporphyrinogen decarboxylase (URO-D)